ncbi:MAG: hypothetical protein ACE5Z5_01310 [Candidatus Bathyarchaeia archaeon]
MRRRSGPRPVRLPSKEEIREEAERGVFDRNPLLATPHEVVCKDCGYRNKAVFLEYLRSGEFELGETEMVEVFHAAPTLTGLGRTLERVTPLIVRVKCDRCGAEISHSPLSLEYLLFTMRSRESFGLYV